MNCPFVLTMGREDQRRSSSPDQRREYTRSSGRAPTDKWSPEDETTARRASGRNANSRYSPGFGAARSPKGKEPARPKEGPSGKLTEKVLTKNGVALKYAEPIEQSRPERKWRLHVFKGERQVTVIPLHDKSFYRIGRDPLVRMTW